MYYERTLSVQRRRRRRKSSKLQGGLKHMLAPSVEICPVGREYDPKHAVCRKCPVKCKEKAILRRESKPSKTSKYGNHKVEVDGITFDSKKEANRYRELKMMERAGEIQGLELQPVFDLIPKQDGERAVRYLGDFRYTKEGKTVVEDVKSSATKTQVYRIKRKLMLYVHGIRVREV